MTTQKQSYEAFWKAYDRIEKQHHIALNDIAIFCGADVNVNTRAACKKAEELLRSGSFKRALILNTASNQRWALRIGREASELVGDDLATDTICMMGIPQGELSRWLNVVTQAIERHGFDVVLINSWELASATHRLREELIFSLHQLTALNTSIVIYSQAPLKEFTAGKILRGLGKLSALAQIITPLDQNPENIVTDQPAVEAFVSEATDTQKTIISPQFVTADGYLSNTSATYLPEIITPVHNLQPVAV
ncbi:MAG TPA: hypothetical protein VFO76_00635 [Candidatus Kapabacteria bacterium]|nr:hypothetical protein [Candidatus Kapabacteria bacterium]